MPGLAAACLLLDEIQDVASRNQDFQKVVKPLWRGAYGLLQETFASASAMSTPSAAHEAVLRIVSRTSSYAGPMDAKHLSAVRSPGLNGACDRKAAADLSSLSPEQLIELLQHPHASVQQAVYTTVAAIVRVSVDSLVLTVETRRQEDDSALPEIALPERLLAFIQPSQAPARPALLAWLLIFIYFQDTVRWALS